MMGGNVAPSPMMGGNVTPRPPPPFVNRRPLPTWYMQLGRTRPLLLNNNTPFPSRTPPAAFMLPNPPIHWLASFPAGAAGATNQTKWTYNDEGAEEEEFGFKKQYIDFE